MDIYLERINDHNKALTCRDGYANLRYPLVDAASCIRP